MRTLDRFAQVAAASGEMIAEAGGRTQPCWQRYRNEQTGLSFEVPFTVEDEGSEGPFKAVAQGSITLPYVLDVTFLATQPTPDACAEDLVRAMATQWSVDYDTLSGPTVQRADFPGIDEAWTLSAEIVDEAGTIDYSWVTLRKGETIGCLSVSCWAAESRGREAVCRTLNSISGD